VNIALPRTETVTSDYDQKSSSLRLVLMGDITSTSTIALHRDVFAILNHEQAKSLQIVKVEVDIKSANMVDSLGLNLIIAILKWAKQREAGLSITVSKLGVYSVMLAVGLDRQAEVIHVARADTHAS